MKRMKFLLLTGSIFMMGQGLYGTEILNRTMSSKQDLKGTYGHDPKHAAIVRLPDGTSALEFTVPDGVDAKKSRNAVNFHLDGKKLRGRRIRFEAEYKKELLPPLTRWGGGQFTFWTPLSGKKSLWDHVYIGTGKEGWKKVEKIIDFPLDTSHSVWSVGTADACGKIYFRNLKATEMGTVLPFESVANMGLVDKKSGDGKGGWSDQGPGQDARRFPKKRTVFANVPFRIVDPDRNQGKSILSFRAAKLPDGLEQAEINLGENGITGRYFYLLSASAWGQKNGTPLGSIELVGKNGKKHEWTVRHNEDSSDAYMPKGKKNAFLAVTWSAGDCPLGAFIARFPIPADFGSIEKVIFHHAKDATAMWMVLGATISRTKYEYPEQQMLVMKENETWKALPQKFVPAPKAGTALDLSSILKQEPAGTFGRVVIRNGKFVFEKKPDEPLRFLAVGTGRDYGKYFFELPEIGSKAQIEAYVTQMRRAGYNMIRMWVEQLRTGKEKAFEYNRDLKDKHDYLVSCLKKNGIYIFYSLPNPTFGFDFCNRWSDSRLKTYNLYTNRRDREAWLKGATKLLTEVNPYTKTRLIDDPVLAILDCNNEQEFAFSRADHSFAGIWREFLKKKYQNFSNLQKAWGKEADGLKQFDDIKTFTPLGTDFAGQKLRDKAEFVTAQERGLLEWEQSELRQLGWKGPVTSFLMGKSLANVGVRKNFDYVSMNSYHSHPSAMPSVTTGGSVQQISSVGTSANVIRSFLAAREYNKPYVISEHGHVFWNKYRYEQGFVMGGFGSLNDLDVMTAFFMPVTTNPNTAITQFEIRHDPILRAAELMTALMFRRCDVKPSDVAVRVHVDLADAIAKNMPTDTVNSEQLKMGLFARFYVDQTRLPLRKNEYPFVRVGGSKTAVRHADSNVVDSKEKLFDLDDVVRKMKADGVLAKSNRTDSGKGIYESSTGEILLDSSRNFMRIDTPRLQGISGEAGTTFKLPCLEIRGMNRRGNITLASIDGNRPLHDAGRLLLILSTNVLNTNMSFESADQVTRIKSGSAPLLLETGKFDLSVKSPRALKCWALALDGTRIAEIPLKRSGENLDFSVDTAKIKDGPVLYFEFAEK